MRRSSGPASAIAFAALLIGAAACNQAQNPAAPAGSLDGTQTAMGGGAFGAHGSTAITAGAEVNRQLAEVRAATAKYHKFDMAIADGFVQVSPCVEGPAGGMGFHYGLPARINDPAINHLEPEVLLYAPDKQGGLHLVAVEYIVPAPIWPGGPENPPSLFGLEFHPGPPPLLILHAWIWLNNPSGIFEDFNPRVSCEGFGAAGSR